MGMVKKNKGTKVNDVIKTATDKKSTVDREIAEKPKSKIALFWETIPENRFEIIDMEAILK